jgi:hypothetical protein
MSRLAEALAARAIEEGLPAEIAHRRHLLHGVLRRLAPSPHAEALVLRGGLLPQLWAGAAWRSTRDIDFLCLFPADIEESQRRLLAVLGRDADDGVEFELDTLRSEVIWQETDFPGHRFHLDVCLLDRAHALQIDLGFDDPLVPPAEWVDYPCLLGAPARVQCARPELMAAWKLHGLFEHGAKRWQAKDLYDLWLLTTRCALDHAALSEAIPVAFRSRGTSLAEVPVFFNPAWWQSETARHRWAKYRAASAAPVPEDLAGVADEVARRLRPSWGRLSSLPGEEAG